MAGKDPHCCDVSANASTGSGYSWRALYGRLIFRDTCWAHETLALWL